MTGEDGLCGKKTKEETIANHESDEDEVGLGKETCRMDCGGLEECNLV